MTRSYADYGAGVPRPGRTPIDELTNEQLAASPDAYGYGDLLDELHRVEQVILNNVMAGFMLTEWYEREALLKAELKARDV